MGKADKYAESKERVTETAAQFNQTLIKLAEFIADDVVELTRTTAVELYSAIVSDTPIDRGYLRANYHLGNTADHAPLNESSFPKSRDAPFRGVPPKHGEVATDPPKDPKFDPRSDVWLVNPVDYFDYIEGGHSSQAGSGMVSNNLTLFELFLRKKATELGLDTYIKQG